MANRLAQETSPYLLQHQDNPIDWMPWGEEAFLRAKLEDKPVFLSVGYSSCHWCHVMAHESFEDHEVALALNSSFISIKVDREERPDVDEAYMTAVQVATGRGGWPMTVFMTPDKKPFFCGTYFPKDSRPGSPGFLTIINSLATAWREERSKVLETSAQFSEHLRAVMGRDMAPSQEQPHPHHFDGAVAALAEEFDGENGGFSGAPKFPPHSALRFLFDYTGARTTFAVEPPEGAELEQLVGAAGSMAVFTLERMAMGGIHDHVGGGFHRYSTDERWLLPHFEKMLSDNGLLLWAYSTAQGLVEDPSLQRLFGRSAQGIVDWVKREMTSPEGMFFSALDADSEGEEGVFYTWSLEELRGVLGGEADRVAELYGCLPHGNFLDEATRQATGANILHGHTGEGMEEHLAALLAARERRVRPGLDHKCLCSWNGLMISGLAAAGEVEMARRCAQAWIDRTVAGVPPHQVTGGKASGEPFLDDFAYLIEGFIDLYEADQDPRWLAAVEEILPAMLERHQDEARGGFYFVGSASEVLFARTKPVFDQAAPSPNGVALRVMGRLGLQEAALPHAQALLPWIQKMPAATETALSGLLYWVGHQPAPEAVAVAAAAPVFDPAQIRVFLNPREVMADQEGWGHAMVTIDLPEGIHINTNEPPARWLTPTSLKVEGVWGEAGFPASDDDQYRGEVNIPIRLRPKKGTDEFQLTITFQPCTETECMAPQERQLTGVLIVP